MTLKSTRTEFADLSYDAIFAKLRCTNSHYSTFFLFFSVGLNLCLSKYLILNSHFHTPPKYFFLIGTLLFQNMDRDFQSLKSSIGFYWKSSERENVVDNGLKFTVFFLQIGCTTQNLIFKILSIFYPCRITVCNFYSTWYVHQMAVTAGKKRVVFEAVWGGGAVLGSVFQPRA